MICSLFFFTVCHLNLGTVAFDSRHFHFACIYDYREHQKVLPLINGGDGSVTAVGHEDFVLCHHLLSIA